MKLGYHLSLNIATHRRRNTMRAQSENERTRPPPRHMSFCLLRRLTAHKCRRWTRSHCAQKGRGRSIGEEEEEEGGGRDTYVTLEHKRKFLPKARTINQLQQETTKLRRGRSQIRNGREIVTTETTKQKTINSVKLLPYHLLRPPIYRHGIYVSSYFEVRCAATLSGGGRNFNSWAAHFSSNSTSYSSPLISSSLFFLLLPRNSMLM